MTLSNSAHERLVESLERVHRDLFRRHGLEGPFLPDRIPGRVAYCQSDRFRLKIFAEGVDRFEFAIGPREPEAAWFEEHWCLLPELLRRLDRNLSRDEFRVHNGDHEALDVVLRRVTPLFDRNAWRTRLAWRILDLSPESAVKAIVHLAEHEAGDRGDVPSNASMADTGLTAPAVPDRPLPRLRFVAPLARWVFDDPNYGAYLREAGFVAAHGADPISPRDVTHLRSAKMRLRVTRAEFGGYYFDAAPLRPEAVWYEQEWTSLYDLVGWLDPACERDPLRKRVPPVPVLRGLHERIVAFFGEGGAGERESFLARLFAG